MAAFTDQVVSNVGMGYNLGQNRWGIYTPLPNTPPPPNNRNRKMVHFGFCVALFLIWGGGGWGFAVPFLMSKVAAPQGPPTI